MEERDDLGHHAPGIGESVIGGRIVELLDQGGPPGKGAVAEDGG